MSKYENRSAKIRHILPSHEKSLEVEASSVRQEQMTGRKMGNAEAKVGAHLDRLFDLEKKIAWQLTPDSEVYYVDEEAQSSPEAIDQARERIWSAEVGRLIIKSDEIPQSYWDTQAQLARDNGMGDVIFDEELKERATRELQHQQRSSLELWSAYLQSVQDDYPQWYIYTAWRSVERMGVFNKEKGCYSKRSKGSVSPYPVLSPEALERTYDALEEYYASGGADVIDPVASGNFNKIYSHYMLDAKDAIPTPECEEDVEGIWEVYGRGDIGAITEASVGTDWCIAHHNAARWYTQNGGYFHFFFLIDPQTGRLSKTACASVRINSDGYTAGIYGIKEGGGQRLEDALVSTVEERVVDLPGGESYLTAFADRQVLIAMDELFQEGQSFTPEQIEFIQETERPIRMLDNRDPRIDEFRKHQYDEHQRPYLLSMYGRVGVRLMESRDAHPIVWFWWLSVINMQHLIEYLVEKYRGDI